MKPPLRVQNFHSVFYARNPKLRSYRVLPKLRTLQWESQRYLWYAQRASAGDSKGQGDTILSPGVETSDSKLFAAGSSLSSRMSADRKFQCTQFDKKGNIYMGHGHIQRSELVSKVSIISFPSDRGPN
jgi:hypothetical protein